MTIDDINNDFKLELDHAVSAWSVDKNPQYLLDLIEHIQEEAYFEGIDRAKDLLNDFLIEYNVGGRPVIPSAS